VLGRDDRSIPVQLTLRNLERLKVEGRPFEWRTYDGLDHSLGPQIWPDIAEWLAKYR
jgi:predicted esterase